MGITPLQNLWRCCSCEGSFTFVKRNLLRKRDAMVSYTNCREKSARTSRLQKCWKVCLVLWLTFLDTSNQFVKCQQFCHIFDYQTNNTDMTPICKRVDDKQKKGASKHCACDLFSPVGWIGKNRTGEKRSIPSVFHCVLRELGNNWGKSDRKVIESKTCSITFLSLFSQFSPIEFHSTGHSACALEQSNVII